MTTTTSQRQQLPISAVILLRRKDVTTGNTWPAFIVYHNQNDPQLHGGPKLKDMTKYQACLRKPIKYKNTKKKVIHHNKQSELIDEYRTKRQRGLEWRKQERKRLRVKERRTECRYCDEDNNERYHHGYCKQCYIKHMSTRHSYFITALSRARNASINANEFTDIQVIVELWNKQRGRCTLTGLAMTTSKQYDLIPTARFTNASIDRIDSTLPYSLNNIQLVCLAVNLVKRNYTDPQLAYICNRVVQFRPDLVQSSFVTIQATPGFSRYQFMKMKKIEEHENVQRDKVITNATIGKLYNIVFDDFV